LSGSAKSSNIRQNLVIARISTLPARLSALDEDLLAFCTIRLMSLAEALAPGRLSGSAVAFESPWAVMLGMSEAPLAHHDTGGQGRPTASVN